MNIRQFRDVLEKVAAGHARLGADKSASALRNLAAALKGHDKVTVQRFVADAKNLRKTRKITARRTRESA